MNKLIVWFVLAAVVAVGALGAYWWFDLRWRPKTITKHQAEIARILEQSGWVSPGLTGPKLYMIGFRSCPDCVRLKAEEFPRFHKAGVDTRVIEVARRDVNGVAKSTPIERTTVAELWINRSWALQESWDSVPIEAWKAQGLPPADGDIARRNPEIHLSPVGRSWLCKAQRRRESRSIMTLSRTLTDSWIPCQTTKEVSTGIHKVRQPRHA